MRRDRGYITKLLRGMRGYRSDSTCFYLYELLMNLLCEFYRSLYQIR